MNCLNISLRGKEAIVQLYFKKYEDALAACRLVENRLAFVPTEGPHHPVSDLKTLRDDYGQVGLIDTAEVVAAIVTDMKQYFDAASELAIMQHRAQNEAQQRATSIVSPMRGPSIMRQ